MSKKTKVELENRKTKIKASRWSLSIVLFLEVVIVLMHFPGFLGVEWLENSLVSMRTFLVEFSWPQSAADMVTYKGTIYEICTWFQKLPDYDQLVQVIIYLVPFLFVLTFIRIRILDWRIKLLDKPEKAEQQEIFNRIRGTKSKESFAPQSPKVKEWGMLPAFSRQKAEEANEYCERHRQRCDDPFGADPGIRIQRPVGEIGMGESRDFVKSWDANGEVDLTAILRRPVKVKLENGDPYIYTVNQNRQVVRSAVPMISFDPMGFTIPEDEGNVVVCIVTWLGGL